MKLDWDHFYLLAWYGANGRAYLTSWTGDEPLVYAIVKGVPEHKMTVWAAPVHPGAELLEIPPDKVTQEDRLAYAREVGGLLAFGWYIAEGITRKMPVDPLWGPRSQKG